jgi:hypothetical protein
MGDGEELAEIYKWKFPVLPVPQAMLEHRRRHLAVNCPNAKSPKSLNVVLQGLERFGEVPLPIRDLARDPYRCRERYDFVGLPRYFLSARLGSSIIGPVPLCRFSRVLGREPAPPPGMAASKVPVR